VLQYSMREVMGFRLDASENCTPVWRAFTCAARLSLEKQPSLIARLRNCAAIFLLLSCFFFFAGPLAPRVGTWRRNDGTRGWGGGTDWKRGFVEVPHGHGNKASRKFFFSCATRCEPLTVGHNSRRNSVPPPVVIICTTCTHPTPPASRVKS
jgi:hypothetical protein